MELQKITTEVPPTSFPEKIQQQTSIDYDTLLKQLQTALGLDNETSRIFEQSIFSEKNKSSHFTKIICDMLILALEQDDINIQTPSELLIHRQNKKLIKDTLIFLLNNLKNYRLDDKKLKIFLAGKLLQSLYESKT